jgi:hypothetical protein
MMGKMVLDTLRGVELLAAHAQIDPGKWRLPEIPLAAPWRNGFLPWSRG